MSLHALPAGARVLVDANILIYARRGMSVQCRELLERCAQREISGVLTTIGLAEFCHRRMMQEAQSRGLSGSNPAKALSQDPTLVRQLTQYRQDMEDVLAGDFTVLTITEADFPQALALQQLHGLMTNDSLHLAAGLRVGLRLVATADPQFDAVPGITVFRPDDL
jgi:predicted nucleic acid-binding protein